MSYQAEISRDNPTCFLFIIDQSGSMDEKTESGRSEAQFVADVLNKTMGLLQIEWVIFAILRAIPVFDGDAIADW